MFDIGKMPGSLVPISGTDPQRGPWHHSAFLPAPMPEDSPDLSGATYRDVGNARAALAALDSTARQLPNPQLLRRSTLRTEAQSTSALEGTYEPLARVLTADEDAADPRLREVLNYETVAERAYAWIERGRSLTVPMLNELQLGLVSRTPLQSAQSGAIRTVQVVIGRRTSPAADEVPIRASRFVPPPPGLSLEAGTRDLLRWMAESYPTKFDPVVAAALAHYQFETLHPFHDGNGRIGRLLIVLHLSTIGTLSEPTLSVSPWFEARREEYQDRLLKVSTTGEWDGWVSFFSRGIASSATATRQRMLALTAVQSTLKETVRQSSLRAESAYRLVDLAVSRLSFTIRQVESGLDVSYGRANSLVSSLVNLGVLAPLDDISYNRRFYSPAVLDVLVEPLDR